MVKKNMKPVSEGGKPPFVRGPKADGIHLGAITGAGSGRPVEARFSLHPQGLTVSPACARPHRRRIIALTRGRSVSVTLPRLSPYALAGICGSGRWGDFPHS